MSCCFIVFSVVPVSSPGVRKEHLPLKDVMGWRNHTRITWAFLSHTFFSFPVLNYLKNYIYTSDIYQFFTIDW